MAGVIFPDIGRTLGPLIQMDQQREMQREQNALRSQERADNLAFRKEESQQRNADRDEMRAMRIQTQLAGMDEKKRAMVQGFATFRAHAGGAILGMSPEQQPQAYAMFREGAKARGYDLSLFPEQWSPATAARLKFDVEQSIPWADRAIPFQPGGGAPAAAPAPGGAPGDPLARSSDAISGIESGGKYDALGPETRGDRAYGKYQVMGANIPGWTQEALGKPMTPQEFLANPQAQDAVFKHKFGQYIQKYGPEGAAKAWFAGEGGMNNPDAKDVLGTSVASYAQKFNKGFGGPQVADAGGFTPTNTPAQNVPGALPQMPEQGGGEGGDVRAPLAAPAQGTPLPTTEGGTVSSTDLLTQIQLPAGARFVTRGGKISKNGDAYEIMYSNGTRGEVRAPPKPTAPPSGYQTPGGGLRYEEIPGGPAERERLEKERAAVAATNKQGAEQTKASTEQANKLRDDFRSEPDVKRFRVVVPILESAKEAGPTRAGDLNLIYAFAKLMDPESVVRESESGMVTATGTFGDRLAGITSQLNGKQALQADTRKKLIAELDSRFKSLQTSYQEIENAYGEIADSNGIKRSHVILPIRRPKTDTPQGDATPTTGAQGPKMSPEEAAKLPPGTPFIGMDGVPRVRN